MPQSLNQRREALVALGADLTPEMVGGTIALSVPDIDPSIYDGVTFTKDVSYGDHERHVLDVYSAAGGRTDKPVLVYVHGGGFVQGAKDSPATPYFANFGSWAVQHGYVGVAINYRLAPDFPYPSGAEDIAAAITWIVDNIADYGGDPAEIYLSGQSAGAMHVADYVVGHGGFGPHGRALRGAVLVSGLYDIGRVGHSPLHFAYWGNDTAKWPEYETLSGLVDSDLPLLFTVSEFDPKEFLDHATQLVEVWFSRRGQFAPIHLLDNHNHLTPVYAVGTPWDTLGPLIQRFIATASATPSVDPGN